MMNVKAKLKKVGSYIKQNPKEVVYFALTVTATVTTACIARDNKKLRGFFNFVHEGLMDGEKHVVWTQHSSERGCEIFIGEPVRWVEDKKQYQDVESVKTGE